MRPDYLCEGRRAQVEPRVFGQAEGMLSAECNEGTLPGSCRTSDGRLWFPTTRGVVAIDPRALKNNNVPPPVVIEEVVANNRVGSAEEALETIPAKCPEVILLDIHLPGLSGIEILPRLKAACPDAQISMLTVFEDEEMIYQSLASGATVTC